MAYAGKDDKTAVPGGAPLLFAWWRRSGVEVVGSHHVLCGNLRGRGPREPFELEIPGRSFGSSSLRRVPWPLAGLPFPFDDIMMMYGGTSALRRAGLRPTAPAVALQPCGKRVDPNDVCTGKDAIPPLDALLSWLTMPVRVPDVDEDQYAVPTFAWPTRLLSILAWLGRDCDTYRLRNGHGLGYVQSVRHIAPRGYPRRFDALLQLSLRVVRDAAGPLHDALSEAGLLQAVGIVPRPGGPPRLLADAIAGLGPVPGAPLDGWSVLRELRKGASARRLYSWGWARRPSVRVSFNGLQTSFSRRSTRPSTTSTRYLRFTLPTGCGRACRAGGGVDGDVPARVRAVAASRDARCEGAPAQRVPRAVGLSRAPESALQRGVPHGLGGRSYDARAVARRRLHRVRLGARQPRAVAS